MLGVSFVVQAALCPQYQWLSVCLWTGLLDPLGLGQAACDGYTATELCETRKSVLMTIMCMIHLNCTAAQLSTVLVNVGHG